MSLVERHDLGYSRAVRDEVTVAPMWELPLTLYIQHLRARRLSEGTVKLRSYQIRHLSRNFLDRDPWGVTGQDLEAVLAAETTWHSTAARSAVAGWRGFYKWAVAHPELPITVNPAAELGPRKSKIGKPRPAPLRSIEEAVAQADERVRLMIYLGAEAGLRRAEIAKVHTRDMYRDSRGWMLNVNGKGDKDREVPLSSRISSLLLACPEGWVFPSHHRGITDGSPADDHITPDRVGKLVGAALGPGVTPHMLRHRFASDMYVMTGHNIRAVQKALGHESVATTQIYTEVPDQDLRDGVDGIASMYVDRDRRRQQYTRRDEADRLRYQPRRDDRYDLERGDRFAYEPPRGEYFPPAPRYDDDRYDPRPRYQDEPDWREQRPRDDRDFPRPRGY